MSESKHPPPDRRLAERCSVLEACPSRLALLDCISADVVGSDRLCRQRQLGVCTAPLTEATAAFTVQHASSVSKPPISAAINTFGLPRSYLLGSHELRFVRLRHWRCPLTIRSLLADEAKCSPRHSGKPFR